LTLAACVIFAPPLLRFAFMLRSACGKRDLGEQAFVPYSK